MVYTNEHLKPVNWVYQNIPDVLYEPKVLTSTIEEETGDILREELTSLEGIQGQNPESGYDDGSLSYLSKYTNRLFGAPYQLMDSVDRRFDNVNPRLGSEYLRNFILNSPILYVKPGMPHYTGGDNTDSLWSHVQNIYMDKTIGGKSFGSALLDEISKSITFGAGAKLQRRMFGFRETYYDYMQHVNYMCRSVAVFLSLTEGTKFPTGTFIGDDQFVEFESMYWENYRLITDSNVLTPTEYFGNMVKSIFTRESSIAEEMAKKVSCVEFMVEPVSFTESITNDTSQSAIEAAIEAVGSKIGSEVAFFSNSNVAPDMIENVMEFLGDTTQNAAMSLQNMMSNVSGGFVTGLFTGALQSIKGQKMIYPEIYQKTTTSMNYSFDIILSTPYGDVYNYYMNIVVPLLHLIALAAPRMVTSNSTTSPYLVQAYIPGQCTCNLGIVANMTITKNPTSKHVSVNGFPLTVKVNFTIKELYNALAISPADNPVSFLYNETLNDYLANMAGLIPSINTYEQQRISMFESLDRYLTVGSLANDVLNGVNTMVGSTFSQLTR